jgi:hypothetical protein
MDKKDLPINLLCVTVSLIKLLVLEALINVITRHMLLPVATSLLDQSLAVDSLILHCKDPGSDTEPTIY